MQGFFPVDHLFLSGHSPAGAVHHGAECGRALCQWLWSIGHKLWRILWTHI
ncbi:MAG: hypothetical protein OZSIB_0509 [Candidatus Ozemobacter sibiricus]|jgi:hypothetical protein|uniref:Uncharacterized protein n=1 Tax=Candidatus Ozemobacter sibiricus TaxID=2268124 RepID=A0A367ZLI0_9BACT|nr:MAG: hypothetical protein OZSIB_0509 [Candidatus Ozemobacter sibiricus]